MIVSRRVAAAAMPLLAIALASRSMAADEVRVLQSTPAASAVIDGRSSEFFVRFDRPVDHIKSRLVIRQGDRVIETLQPRLESAPEVLFARAPTLPAGGYTLHWSVITLQGAQVVEGDIPFKVAD